MIKNRHPLLCWLLAIFTGGIFAYVWVYLMARDANILAGAERIKIKRHVMITVTLGVVYLGFFAASMRAVQAAILIVDEGGIPEFPGTVFYFGFLVALGLVAHIVAIILKTAGVVRERVAMPTSAILVVLTVVYLISLPILQHKMNQIK